MGTKDSNLDGGTQVVTPAVTETDVEVAVETVEPVTETVETPSVETAAAPVDAEVEAEVEAEEETEDEEVSKDPKLKKLNAENQSLRKRLRDLEEKVAFESNLSKVLKASGLTEEHVPFLKGNTESELLSSANSLKALLGVKTEEPVVEEKPAPKTESFTVPPKSSFTPDSEAGTSDLVARRDFAAINKLLKR